jgi:hypothetical protein
LPIPPDRENLVDGPLVAAKQHLFHPPEDNSMAKALVGYLGGTDPRVTARLTRENNLLRQRIADLEAVAVRLQKENDALAAMVSESAAAEVLELA